MNMINPDSPAPDQKADQSPPHRPSSMGRGDGGVSGTSYDGPFLAPDIDAQGRDFAVVAPFVPTEQLVDALRRTALPRLQRVLMIWMHPSATILQRS